MKLSCYCNHCTRKVHLSSQAKTRYHLVNSSGAIVFFNCPHCHSQTHIHANNVRAESSRKNIPFATAGAGGVVGIIAGPLGVLIGAGVGAISGSIVRNKENIEIQNFNNHFL